MNCGMIGRLLITYFFYSANFANGSPVNVDSSQNFLSTFSSLKPTAATLIAENASLIQIDPNENSTLDNEWNSTYYDDSGASDYAHDVDVSNINVQAPPVHYSVKPKLPAEPACDVSIGSNTQIWKGNQTRELFLPILVQHACTEDVSANSVESMENCTMATMSWEGTIEIQSGDVLLVRIDDSDLIQNSSNGEVDKKMREPATAVYQVTRQGHDYCDITEGVLLDITPLKIENRKVVTLYDKDLTEGINHLIVASLLWEKRCVRLKVTVKSENCGDNGDCNSRGVCFANDSMDVYECQCCSGYVGAHCEEKESCFPSPCHNNGICVDTSEGREGINYQCLCPYGYNGKICETSTDPCTSMPCRNGATCSGNVSHFSCKCASGFTGYLCQHKQNECESSPCAHGICVDEEDKYKCFCQPGYTGDNCEHEYNECESSPCMNGSTCTDRINDFECACPTGYTGKRCENKVNLCIPNPCKGNRSCIDQGTKYECKCEKGFGSTECSKPLPRQSMCAVNPCNNGGSCWNNYNSFYCACKPGFTGKTCNDEFVMEKIYTDDFKSEDVVMSLPTSVHKDHFNNIYIGMGSLVSAIIIVIVIVLCCQCQVNNTYKKFVLPTYQLWIGRARGRRTSRNHVRSRKSSSVTAANTEWFSGCNKTSATQNRSLTTLDSVDMFYTLDFSDNQHCPLIK